MSGSRKRWACGLAGLFCLSLALGAWAFSHRIFGRTSPPWAGRYDLPADEEHPSLAVLAGGKDWQSAAEELRKLHPYESLADRLASEEKAPGADPVLPATTAARLQEEEETRDKMGTFASRAKSLAMLHSGEVERFINQEGFGNFRMFRADPSPRYLDLPPAKPIPVDPTTSPAAQDEEAVPLPRDEKEAALAGLRLPPLKVLDAFHGFSGRDFASDDAFGHVKDRQHIAGFRAHGFRSKPDLMGMMPGIFPPAGAPKERWLISRLELVSLLKHEKPAVYVSQHLPRMEDARKGKTRALTEFEAQALGQLEKGEDLVTEATPNRIRLVGSLRAVKQCLECHGVQRGALLGAFSYDLHRDPPVKAKKAVPH